MQEVIGALILTLIAGSATGIGGALVLFKKRISSNFLAAALGVSAGVMIFISLAELFPEAQAMISGTGLRHGEALVLVAFFVGMGIITLIDFTIPEYENPHEASGLSLSDRTAAVGVLEHTGNEKWLRYARENAHYCASWVVSYNYRFPEKSEFGRHDMKTVGSVFANIQNKHSAPGICTCPVTVCINCGSGRGMNCTWNC
jgi:zinc transporter ZupT